MKIVMIEIFTRYLNSEYCASFCHDFRCIRVYNQNFPIRHSFYVIDTFVTYILPLYLASYEGKMKSSRPSLRGTRDKRQLGRDPERS